MPSHHVPKDPANPLSLAQAPRGFGGSNRLKENVLLLSGIGLVLVAATMVVTTMFG